MQEEAKELIGFLSNTSEVIKDFTKFLIDIFKPAVTEFVDYLITDRLKFRRAKNLITFKTKVLEKAEKLRLSPDDYKELPIKIGIPILENASLEEDNSLQELWANLMTKALDPNFKEEIRTAYIDIIKGLSPLDVKILNYCYEFTMTPYSNVVFNTFAPKGITFYRVLEDLKLQEDDLLISIYNLFRLRVLSPLIKELGFDYYERHVGSGIMSKEEYYSIIFPRGNKADQGHYEFAVTMFGKFFIEACIKE